jgi:hypothetical protein
MHQNHAFQKEKCLMKKQVLRTMNHIWTRDTFLVLLTLLLVMQPLVVLVFALAQVLVLE